MSRSTVTAAILISAIWTAGAHTAERLRNERLAISQRAATAVLFDEIGSEATGGVL